MAQTTMAPGPVEYKRKYTLWVLVLLIIICWPVAIIYYFTREKVPVQEYRAVQAAPPTWAAPPPPGAPAPGTRFCSRCGAANMAGATNCGKCGAPLQ